MRWALARLAVVAALSAGCGPQPFTHAMRSRLGNDEAALRGVQYYLGAKCVFERRIDTSVGEVARGRVEVRAGVAVDVVKIPKHTPGVVEFVLPEQLAVSFAPGSFFYFGPGPDGRYTMLGRVDPQAQRFVVLHAGHEYVMTSPDPCTLEVRRSVSKSRVKQRTTLPGRRLD